MAKRKRKSGWRRLGLALLVACLTAGAAGGVVLYWLIAVVPGPAIRPENIREILAVESPVFYRDGEHKIGVFFREQHRQYVPYDRIPSAFVNAIVAAEDAAFFEHHGVDFRGVLRALVANLKAGRVVQGGSTLTQQTAKNLFKRRGRTLRAKLKELLYAWRLEYHYSKEQILEFYANQFYVSGNGRGLAVAARYFFDKPVEELTLLECVFIAGSVQRPNAYNPFIKKTPEAAALARRLAQERARYVLGRMLALGMIDQATYDRLADQPIPFRRGRMAYAANALLDQVRAALDTPEVEEALSRHGIDNIATSGVRIYTTVDKDLQQRAEEAMRLELSRLEVRLSGYDPEVVRATAKTSKRGRAPLRKGAERYGVVRGLAQGDDGRPVVEVDLGDGEQGIIDYLGLRQVLLPLVRYERHRWVTAGPGDLPVLLDRLQPGDPVFVHLRERDAASGVWLLDLQRDPEIEGGLLVYRQGRILALVGGYDNRDFNRAMQARRTLGSVFKPILYAAAMQLGWTSADLLRNARDAFIFFDQAYIPRPDHPSPFQEVSMAWAGVTSENVASVWLLYHLCDRLTPAQFDEVARRVGIGPQAGESAASFRRRVRDRYGIVVNKERLRRAAFEWAAQEIEADLVFAGRLDDLAALRSLHFRIDPTVLNTDHPATPSWRREMEIRRRIVRRSFVAVEESWRRFQRWLATDGDAEGGVFQRNGRYAFFRLGPPADDPGWTPVANGGTTLDPVQADGVLIEGLLSAATVADLARLTEERLTDLSRRPPYSEEVLRRVADYRVLVGISYLIGLCRSLGMTSDLEPVLSFPLGANVVTLLEAVRAYEGLMRGVVTEVTGEEEALAILDRIETPEGEVIFRPERSARRVLPPRLSAAVSDILFNVVRFGTGRRAWREVRLRSLDPATDEYLAELDLVVPTYGKTGTANRFTNAAYLGFVPGPGDREGLREENGFGIACYVGYDDNRPMIRGTTHITGAAGALPLWIRVANALLLTEDLGRGLDLAELAFAGARQVPVHRRRTGLVAVPVDPEQGGVMLGDLSPGEEPPAVVWTPGRRDDKEGLSLERLYQPYWEME